MGNFDFEIAARGGRIHNLKNSLKMEFDVGPLLVSENHNGNLAPGQILLVANVLVRRQEQIVASLFSFSPLLTILKFMPADLARK